MRLSTLKATLLPGGLLLWLWLFVGLLPASAVHLLGGEMTYKYLDAKGPADKPWRYELTMRVYFNPNTDPVEQELIIRVYSRYTHYGTPIQLVKVNRISKTVITVPTLPGCGQAAPPVALGLYVTTLNLPVTNEGFWLSCTNSNRIAGITNLKNSVDENMTLEVEMTPGTVVNSSPVFASVPVALICVGASSFVANNAYDADGDQLVYVLSKPISAYLPLQVPVAYAPGYSESQPFGPTGLLALNPSTGLSTYFSPAQGVFQLAVDVQEYRQGLLLSTMHRDMQVVVRTCSGPSGLPPAFTAASLAKRDFTIRGGQTLAFDVAATDPDGDPLTLTASSALLDGPGGIEASFGNQPGTNVGANPVGNASIKGVGTVAGTFRLTGCGLDRRVPYEVVVTAADEVCNSQTVVATFRITVARPIFPGSVLGTADVCAQSAATYSVLGGTGFSPFQWSVEGGQVLGPATGPTVQVLWGATGTGLVRVNGTTDLGCPTQPATLPVSIRPGLSVTGPTAYCLTAATGLRYAVSGPNGNYQWTITNGTIVSGQGTREVVVDLSPGATATLRVAEPLFTSCVTTLLVSPDDRCLYFYNVITPNGDTQNETFAIKNIERHPNTALTIFNRWGQKLYHSDDYHNTYGNATTAPGLYYYLCQTAEGAIYKGWFEVFR
ncbi:gliding motility-associated C-terminal domain-containing protein [Hymenobacter sp. BT770]|uniref:T9SS type B sorting domain-containing protein n=1 Tax=Hymenobacter sp. BT770 TaxID=2886942 RepID=UPI001D0FDD46|nr:gliding motility-associated C-terminal domain-containing protein [Hymenobacter sp. BT770]MCC3151569.1 gliding motility-associated C-terminal domain-containing protein [Hymenobacter sp. BT770]MDO3413854.1 gliding motility-associated C-terminal domain-containing protein [Hymenobacter sp. BT770]